MLVEHTECDKGFKVSNMLQSERRVTKLCFHKKINQPNIIYQSTFSFPVEVLSPHPDIKVQDLNFHPIT